MLLLPLHHQWKLTRLIFRHSFSFSLSEHSIRYKARHRVRRAHVGEATPHGATRRDTTRHDRTTRAGDARGAGTLPRRGWHAPHAAAARQGGNRRVYFWSSNDLVNAHAEITTWYCNYHCPHYKCCNFNNRRLLKNLLRNLGILHVVQVCYVKKYIKIYF